MKKEELRIVFMGTPEFAVETLKALVENNYNVVAVVTQPDKPVGRHGSTLQAPPVKQYALQQDIPVLQPEKLKNETFVETLRSYKADLQVVVAYRMLPEVVWGMPRYGTFNVHASLLPKYRGAAPVNWAVINGETMTGITTFFLDKDIDTGRIIMQQPFPIPDTADAEYVYDGLMRLGAQMALKTTEAIITADGHPETRPQEVSSSTLQATLPPAPKLFKDTCIINWQQTAKQVYDFIRGLSPYPGAWSALTMPDGRETTLKILRTTKTTLTASTPPGTITTDRKHIYIAAADSLLQIDELQLAGKKRMDATAFLNGTKDFSAYRIK